MNLVLKHVLPGLMLLLSSCSTNTEAFVHYNNGLVTVVNKTIEAHEEMIRDFHRLVTTDSSEKSRKLFRDLYGQKFRDLSFQASTIIVFDQQYTDSLKKHVIELTGFLAESTRSLSANAEKYWRGIDIKEDVEAFDEKREALLAKIAAEQKRLSTQYNVQ